MNDNTRKISDLIANKPLFAHVIVGDSFKYYYEQTGIIGLPFDYDCPICNGQKTFKLESYVLGNYIDDKYQKDGPEAVDTYTQLYKGVCASCRKYNIDVLLRLSLLKGALPINDTVKVRKIGQYPVPKVKLDKEVKKYLSDADGQLYENALSCINNGMGIAAYTYFRVLLQNEIVKITEEALSSESDEQTKKIRDAYENYLQNKQVSNLIDAIKPHLIPTLNLGHINPLSYLWEQLSTGIHGSMTDVECIESANKINKVLTFVIKKLLESKTEIEDIKKLLQ